MVDFMTGTPRGIQDIPLEVRNKTMTRCWMEMGVALALTALIAWVAATSGAYLRFVSTLGFGGVFVLLIVIVVLGMVISSKTANNTMRPQTARVLFYVYAVLMGFSLSTVFIMYDIKTIGVAFGVCSMYFFVLAMYGMLTKKDLSRLGPILFVGLTVLIIAEVIVYFIFTSPGTIMLVNALSILLFSIMTAMDTQQAQSIMLQAYPRGQDAVEKASINCALSLYLDFLNLFLSILEILGQLNSDSD